MAFIRWYLRNRYARLKEKQDASDINFRFASYLDLNKCFTQIKLPISFETCVPISEILHNIKTLIKSKKNKDKPSIICKLQLFGKPIPILNNHLQLKHINP